MGRDERELDWRRFQEHRFVAPAPDLAPWVARHWVVDWDYERPYRQVVVPYPDIHLSFRDSHSDGDGDGGSPPGPEVHGVSSRHVTRVLAGRGRVVGVAFRAGAFRGFLGRPVRTITDRAVPAAEVFRDLPDVRDLRPLDAEGAVAAVEAMLRAALPPPDPVAAQVVAFVARIAAEPAITRVDVLARELSTGVRQLQRLFAEHVGVGPKWVIRRYRLHEVTERMAAREPIGWVGLAAELGYADQAHLVRDFTAMFGESPTRYAQRY